MQKNNLNLNTIQTVYDFRNLTKSQIYILNFIYKTQNIKINLKKLERMKKVVLDLKKH